MAGKPNAIKLTQTQFFELCMWVKKNQNDLKSKRQKSIVVAKEASEALKFPIAKYSILKAMEATGVTWSPIKTRAVNEGARANIRTLTNAISRLYDTRGQQWSQRTKSVTRHRRWRRPSSWSADTWS